MYTLMKGFKAMGWQDITLLGKKILIGIGLALAPVLILLGSLNLAQRALTAGTHSQRSSLHAK
jgi:hypothetical protein